MDTGWYWYRSDEPRDPASRGDWVILHVDGKGMAGDERVDVGDVSFRLSEMKGQFLGPITPPVDLEEDRRKSDQP